MKILRDIVLFITFFVANCALATGTINGMEVWHYCTVNVCMILLAIFAGINCNHND